MFTGFKRWLVEVFLDVNTAFEPDEEFTAKLETALQEAYKRGADSRQGEIDKLRAEAKRALDSRSSRGYSGSQRCSYCNTIYDDSVTHMTNKDYAKGRYVCHTKNRKGQVLTVESEIPKARHIRQNELPDFDVKKNKHMQEEMNKLLGYYESKF